MVSHHTPTVRPVRIFVAGASGVLGFRLVPLLITEGHDVAAMTRSPHKVEALASTGAHPAPGVYTIAEDDAA